MLLCVQCAARVRPALLPRLYRCAAVGRSRPEAYAREMSNYNWAPKTPGRNVRIQAFFAGAKFTSFVGPISFPRGCRRIKALVNI